ncbi:MAG TPA: CAP domain-containing protein [Chitinophagaceae bacterium]
MKQGEREMIYEINRVRSNPTSYLQYIEPLLATARQTLKTYGKGTKNYSLTFSSSNGIDKKNIDTTWHYMNEENVKALASLVADLKKLKPLSVLQPDSGIYNAACKHANDQNAHNWELAHTGTDGSHPWDRITLYAPSMQFGNENIAGNSWDTTARGIVIQLLIDDGIPGYGHRYNLLDPQWTHAACVWVYYKNNMHWWIQNFGVKKKSSSRYK